MAAAKAQQTLSHAPARLTLASISNNGPAQISDNDASQISVNDPTELLDGTAPLLDDDTALVLDDAAALIPDDDPAIVSDTDDALLLDTDNANAISDDATVFDDDATSILDTLDNDGATIFVDDATSILDTLDDDGTTIFDEDANSILDNLDNDAALMQMDHPHPCTSPCQVPSQTPGAQTIGPTARLSFPFDRGRHVPTARMMDHRRRKIKILTQNVKRTNHHHPETAASGYAWTAWIAALTQCSLASPTQSKSATYLSSTQGGEKDSVPNLRHLESSDAHS